MNRILALVFAIKNDIIFLYYTLINPQTKITIKIVIVGTLLYVFSPFDVVSDFFPIVGRFDDITLVLFVLHWVKSQTNASTPKKQKQRTVRQITSIK